MRGEVEWPTRFDKRGDTIHIPKRVLEDMGLPTERNSIYMVLDDPESLPGRLARAYARSNEGTLVSISDVAQAARRTLTGSREGWQLYSRDVERFIEECIELDVEVRL
jgi:hypothetical protein